MGGLMQRAKEPLRLGDALLLRNRLVGTAHGAGLVADGLAQPADADYWRRRLLAVQRQFDLTLKQGERVELLLRQLDEKRG